MLWQCIELVTVEGEAISDPFCCRASRRADETVPVRSSDSAGLDIYERPAASRHRVGDEERRTADLACASGAEPP